MINTINFMVVILVRASVIHPKGADNASRSTAVDMAPLGHLSPIRKPQNPVRYLYVSGQ